MMRVGQLGIAGLFTLLGLGLGSTARADAGPKFGDGLWLPVGLSLGGAFHADGPDGFVLGGEVSTAYLWMEGEAGGTWLGGVADAVWDFGSDAFRHRVGPEFGWGPVGLDLAYLGQARGDQYDPGVSVRGVFTLAIVSLYGGYGHLFAPGVDEGYGEFGGLVKIPIPLAVETRQLYEPPPAEHEPPAPLEPTGPLQPIPSHPSGPATGVPEPWEPTEPPSADDDKPAAPSPYATPPEPEPHTPPTPERGPTSDTTEPPPFAAPPEEGPDRR